MAKAEKNPFFANDFEVQQLYMVKFCMPLLMSFCDTACFLMCDATWLAQCYRVIVGQCGHPAKAGGFYLAATALAC